MKEIIQPAGWKAARGYANGIVADGLALHIAGQIGWDADQTFQSHDFLGQTEQALKNVLAVVTQAGGSAEHIVRLTWYLTDKREYIDKQRELGEVYCRVMGRNFPAMSAVVVAGLIEDEALLEIEATALLPR